MFTCVYWSCIHFWMCVDLRDQSRNQIIIALCMKYLVPIMSKLDWLRTSAHPLNQRHPLFSWLVCAAYCCLFTGKPPHECQKEKRLKTPPPPRKKQASLHFNSMQHLDAFGLRTLRPGYGAITAFFFLAYRPPQTRRCNEPICATASYLEPGDSREMSSNVSFPKNMELPQKWRNGHDNFQLPRYEAGNAKFGRNLFI